MRFFLLCSLIFLFFSSEYLVVNGTEETSAPCDTTSETATTTTTTTSAPATTTTTSAPAPATTTTTSAPAPATTTTSAPVTTTTTTTQEAGLGSLIDILDSTLVSITGGSTNVQCYQYLITVGNGGSLNLTRFVLELPCLNLCTLLSGHLIDLNIPLDITGSVLGLPLLAQGFIGVDVYSGACGIIVDVDLTPLVVNALDLIYLNICLELDLVLNLLGLLGGVLGGVLGKLDVILGNSLVSSIETLVPNLCGLIPNIL